MALSIEAFKAEAASAGILLDFDGTLSELVPLPHEARPFDGVVETLTALSETYKTVTIVSGRSASELLQWLGPSIDIWGVHGAERTAGGEVVVSEMAAPYVGLMRKVHEEAAIRIEALGIPGVLLEDKGVMLGLHYRAADDHAEAAAALGKITDELAAEFDLWKAEGKRAFELRPPIELSKADVVLQVTEAASLDPVLFAGDDVVDLPAFDALDRLADRGVGTVRVAVTSDEAPAELIERGDVVVRGPEGMLELLRSLV
jgi:trehalose 6-phosphate phosphatase